MSQREGATDNAIGCVFKSARWWWLWPVAVVPVFPTEEVDLNDPPAVQYDLMTDLLDDDMFKVYSDMMRSETLRIHRVLSCVKLVVSELHVSLKADELRMFLMVRMNHDIMEYMRVSYPDTPLSEFKSADVNVHDHGGFDVLDDDEDDE